jgi:hypothetical protein
VAFNVIHPDLAQRLRIKSLWKPRTGHRRVTITRVQGSVVTFQNAKGERKEMPAWIFMTSYRPAEP